MISRREPIHSCLIATLGTEPQVVTATIDLLCQRNYHLEDVVIVHTSGEVSSITTAVEVLRDALSAPQYSGKFRVEFVELSDDLGNALTDVADAEDARAAFRGLYKLIKGKKKKGSRIHLSVTGGRKTLALYGLTAAQLLFDENDRLWYLFSSGDFLSSKRLHPNSDDEVTLVNIPVILWSCVSPVMADLTEVEDPFEAVNRVEALRLKEKYDKARTFILGSLTPAERRVVEALVVDGLSDHEIGHNLSISPRTVEQHLRSAYQKASDHWEIDDVNRTQLITLVQYFFINQLGENPHDS